MHVAPKIMNVLFALIRYYTLDYTVLVHYNVLIHYTISKNLWYVYYATSHWNPLPYNPRYTAGKGHLPVLAVV